MYLNAKNLSGEYCLLKTLHIKDIFRPDPNFAESEEKYKILKKEILDEGSSDDEEEDNEDSGSGSEEDDSEQEEEEEAKQMIIDQTETNLVALRRTIYLTIQSSLDFEECAHKLMKMELKPGQEVELCNMILDCCAQMRTYEKFFGLLAGRFCLIDKKYVEPFQVMFQEQYATIHRLETNKLRNVAKFFAHLLHTDSISWAVLASIKLNEEDTTSASRIFIKILFQELSEYMGLPKLNERLKDQTLQEYFVGLLPRENPRDTRFAINFFTTIGLGGLTDDLRDHLKNVSKKLMQQKQEEQMEAGSETSDSSDEESDTSSDSSDHSSASDSSSDSESSNDNDRRRKKKTETKKARAKGGSHGNSEKSGLETKKHQGGKANGSVEKYGMREKKSKRAKHMVDERAMEEVSRREREDNFRRLAKLADYGDVSESNLGERTERLNEKRIKRKKKDRESFERNRKGGQSYVEERQDRGFDRFDRGYRDGPELGGREREHFDERRDLDRNFERNFDERGRGESRGGRRDRKLVEEERDDRSVRIERNFERMDVYEDKFRRERERNLEVVRGRGDFEDYYRGRRETAQDVFDERGRGFRDERGRFESGDVDWERDMDGRRRRKSEERMAVQREERRKRR